MLTQNWNTKPDSVFYELELPKMQSDAARMLYKSSKGISLNDKQLNCFWTVWKIMNFDGVNWYERPSSAYSHFINWLKFQNAIPEMHTKEEPKINLTPLDEIREKYRKAPRSVTCEEWKIATDEILKEPVKVDSRFIIQMTAFYYDDETGNGFNKAIAMKYFDNL